MAKKLIDILSAAAVVRDETNEKANTAERVGGVLVELANYLSAFAPVSDVTVETEGDSVRLVLHLKNEDGTVSTRSVTLPAASTENAGVLTSELLKALQEADKANEDLAKEGLSKAESAAAMLFAEEAERKETDLSLNDLIEAEVTERLQSMATEAAARKAADAELLKRIIGKSTFSSAYTDPFRYIGNFASEKDENGTVTKVAIRVMQDALLDTLRHSDYRDSFPYIGHMRAHVEGVPIETWNYVKSWNTGSTNGVFVQVVRTNFGLNNGVISSALTEAFHEYFRTVTVSMADGSVTDVTATAWQESNAGIREMADEGISKADAALEQIFKERKERAAADADLEELISEEEGARDTAVNNERAARTAADAELKAKIQDHEDRIWKLENQWYGIEWDTEVSSPSVTRIGNMDLHRALPIQSRMRGCLLDDNGKVTKYLSPKDWTGEVRDGSRGQVMVEIPMHYRRCETDGTKRRVKLSEYPLPGYHQVPRMYVSAYEASIERSTGKLCSVVNEATDYRGGNNNANYDGTYRSFLGRPVTVISRTAFRSAARKRKSGSSEWNCYTYDIHKTLFWLFVVEYATLNSQAGYNREPTSEGYRQGGLGAGVTDMNSGKWSTFNGYYPFIPCGFTDRLGNGTGVVPFTLPTEYDPDAQSPVTTNVPRYRGVENPFGHIWQWTDGINVRISPTVENGGDGLSKVFVCSDPALFKDNGYDGYSYVGNEARNNGFVKEIIGGEYGEIMPAICSGAVSTTFFCDYHATKIPAAETLRCVLFCGTAGDGSLAGFTDARSDGAPSLANANVGSRLCFIPAESLHTSPQLPQNKKTKIT